MAEAAVDNPRQPPSRAGKVMPAEKLAKMVIEQLEAGTAPWMHPVAPGVYGEPARNAVSGHEYRGVNQVLLSMLSAGDGDPRWCTFHQAHELGARVRKGEHGVPVSALVGWLTEEGERVPKEERPPANARPLFRAYTVFHASQLDGIEPYQAPAQPKRDFEPHEKAEELLAGSGATIQHDQTRRCFYRPRTDTIHLPPKENFRDEGRYYTTALHELGHWTGHESRLGRDMGGRFGSERYAREELRAELASFMLAMELGVGHEPGDHVSYVGSWIKALQEDPLEIYRASEDAARIADFVTGRELTHQVEREAPAAPAREAQVRQETYTPEPNRANAAAFGAREDRRAVRLPPGGLHGLRFTLDRERGTEVQVRLGDLALGRIEERGDGSWEFTSGRGGRQFGMPARMEAGAHEEVASRLQDRFYIDVLHGRRMVLEVQPQDRGDVEALGAAWDREREAYTAEVTPLNVGRFGSWLTGPTTLLPDARAREETTMERAEQRSEQAGVKLPEGAIAGLSFYVVSETSPTVEVMVGDRRDTWQKVGWMQPAAEGDWEFIAEKRGRELGLPESRLGSGKAALQTWLQKAYHENVLQGQQAQLQVPKQDLGKVVMLNTTWDNERRGYFVDLTTENIKKYGRWLRGPVEVVPPPAREAPAKGRASIAEQGGEGERKRVDLAVPYAERNAAKALGATWDREGKTWYAMVPEGDGLGDLGQWSKDRPTAARQAPSPVEEFRGLCQAAGLVLDGDPVMDSTLHRVPVEGGKPGRTDGAYVGHLDTRPAGMVQNWKTDEVHRWQYTGEGQSIEQHAKSVREANTRAAERAREREAAQAERAKEIQADLGRMPPADGDHPYLIAKGLGASAAPGLDGLAAEVAASANVRQDEKGNLVVPLRDAAGEVSSVQRIGPGGFKQFEKGGAVSGRYCVVGDEAELGDGPVLLTTGFGTGAAIHAATGRPVVCAMSDTNLAKVGEALRERHGAQGFLILADDDRHKDRNAGAIAAEKALDAVENGRVAYPQWTSAERADARMSDFADVAVSRGLNAVSRQVEAERKAVVELVQDRGEEQSRGPKEAAQERPGAGRGRGGR